MKASGRIAVVFGILRLALAPHMGGANERLLRFDLQFPPQGSVPADCTVELTSAVRRDSQALKATLPCSRAREGVPVPSEQFPLTAVLRAAGHWTQEHIIERFAEAPVIIQAWQLAPFDIPFGIPEAKRVEPVKASFEGLSSSLSEPRPRGEVACSWVVAGERPRCLLPNTLLNLRVEISGFVPEYFWNVDQKQLRTLPPRRARTGSSICGWIIVPSVQKIETEAISFESTPALPRAQIVCPALPAATSGARRCFAQIHPVVPAQYRIAATAGSVAMSRPADVSVTADSETCFTNDLLLENLATARFNVVPPEDAHGKGWSLQIEGQDGPKTARTTEGSVVFGALRQGEYVLTVQDERGSVLRVMPVDVDGPEVNEVVDLDLLQLSGKVTCHDKAVEGELVFGLAPPSVAVELGAAGEFSALLPRVRYDSLLLRQTGRRQQHLDESALDLADRHDRLELAFELPDTRLKSRVIDVRGRPVPDAAVVLFSEERKLVEASGMSDEKGRAEFECLRKGTLLASANSTSGESGFVPVRIEEGRTVEVDLVLEETFVLRGRIERMGQPVANARVLVRSSSVTAQPQPWRTATTDLGGAFELKIPRRPAELVVSASGLPTTFARIPYPLVTDWLTVPLASDYGYLKLGDLLLPENRVLYRNGVQIELGVLRLEWLNSVSPAILAAGGPVVPTLIMEPGEYLVCPQGGAEAGACRPIAISPWTEVALEPEFGSPED